VAAARRYGVAVSETASPGLTRTFGAERYRRALASWHWIGIGAREPLFTSPFGDVFFRAGDGYWWLDTLEATLTRPWDTGDEMLADLNTLAGQDRYLLAGLAAGAARRGLVPGPDEVYDFRIPPVLGGPVEVDNIGVLDFVVCVNIAGQIHDQIRGLPPGATVSGITIDASGLDLPPAGTVE
jgi:hypothetical protein